MAKLEKEQRPRAVYGHTTRVRTQCGNLYITITNKDDNIFEVFAVLGKSGGCVQSQMSALTTAVTLGIRYGVPPQVYVEKLKGIRCLAPSIDEGVVYFSCADAIARVMEEELELLAEQEPEGGEANDNDDNTTGV